MSSLQELDIRQTKVSDLSPLYQLKGLATLKLKVSKFSAQQLSELRENLPDVIVIDTELDE